MKHEFQFDSKKLTFDSVSNELKSVKHWITNQKTRHLSLNLTNIQYIDSAGVAMLVELKRFTHVDLKKNLILKISDQIRQMIQFYELEGLLENTDEY
jgi:anti-anti-sigma factor